MDKIWSPLHGRRALILGDVSLGLIRHVAGRYENVVVLDTLFRPLTEAADLSTLLNARHAEIDHPPLPWDPAYFDGVFSLNFLFPRMDWPIWLREALRVLKPRGRVLIVEPYPLFQRPLGSTVKIIKMWKDPTQHIVYRTKSLLRIMKEIYDIDWRNDFIFFCEDNFTINVKRTHKILDTIIRSGVNNKIQFSSFVNLTFKGHFIGTFFNI